MKKLTIIAGIVCAITATSVQAQSLAFRQGSFQVNVTEGNTYSNYSTTGLSKELGESGGHIIGTRDPIQLEYGITKHWGIGISAGTDLYTMSGPEYAKINSSTSEFTLDGSYHFFVLRKLDLAAVMSYGSSTIAFKSNSGDNGFGYSAKGNIFRTGLHARWFILGHFGLTAMVTAFTENAVQAEPQNFVGSIYSGHYWGIAKEFGICFRINK